jgi:hypothetical protein
MSGWRRTWLMLRTTFVAVLVGFVLLFALSVAFKVLSTL